MRAPTPVRFPTPFPTPERDFPSPTPRQSASTVRRTSAASAYFNFFWFLCIFFLCFACWRAFCRAQVGERQGHVTPYVAQTYATSRVANNNQSGGGVDASGSYDASTQQPQYQPAGGVNYNVAYPAMTTAPQMQPQTAYDPTAMSLGAGPAMPQSGTMQQPPMHYQYQQPTTTMMNQAQQPIQQVPITTPPPGAERANETEWEDDFDKAESKKTNDDGW